MDSKITPLLTVENAAYTYKMTMSGIFAALIGVVIIGFFIIAKWENIAGNIFKNQSGLQFITLFSLVISIVLFGILNILEGKELAALLGAISGYVLGRVSAGEVQSALVVTRMADTSTQGQQKGPAQPAPAAG